MGRYLVRKISEIEEQRSTCGFRRRLVTSEDSEKANFAFLRVDNAVKHYHKKTTEFYYLLEGKGWLELDGEKVEVKPGTLVVTEPGIAHKPMGETRVLLVGIPPLDPDDVYPVKE